MQTTASVVIIGGGVAGLSIAYHLAERGQRDLLVIERARCGAGVTLKATGGFRCQFATAINVQLSLLSLPFWQEFATRFATTIHFRQRGYLFLLTSPDQQQAAEANVAMQQALGVPVRLVTPAEATALSPGINLEGVLAGTYCPWDASLEVVPVMASLIAGCRQRGVSLAEGVTVTSLEVAGGRVRTVGTSAGPVSAPVVINAAGSDAAAIGALVGLTLPVSGERRQAAVTAPTSGIDPEAAWTIDQGTGCYARPAPDGGAVIGGGDRPEAADLPGEELDTLGLARLRQAVGRRFPGLAGVELARAWVGRRPMAADDHPLLGPTAIAGFHCAVGLGGQGLMHAPAIGRLMAELVLDGAPTSLDIGLLDPHRFERGAALTARPLL